MLNKALKENGKFIRGQNAKKLLAGLISVIAINCAQPALAVSDDARYEPCPRCEPKNFVWAAGQFDQVYLVPAAKGANHAQPRTLNAEPLARVLSTISIKWGDKSRGLFSEDSASELARALVTAMAKAGPQQEAVFFIASRGTGGLLATRFANSGTAFLDERGLNLIFGEAAVDFIGAYRATRIARPFDFGSREKASKVALLSNGLAQPRPDWLIVPLGAVPTTATTPTTVGNVTEPAPAAAMVSTPATPVSPASPASPAKASPATRDEQFFQAQEARLKSLKRLREQNLISEEEFQAKRKEILKDL